MLVLAVVLHEAARMIAGSSAESRRRSAGTAFAGTCLLFVAAPFERLRPVASLPWQDVTTVEAVMALALGAWCVALVVTRETPSWRAAITAPWVAWLAVALLAALLAPAFRLNALKTVGRLAGGLLVLLLPLNGITSSRRLATAIGLGACSAVAVAALAALEYAGVPSVVSGLGGFREGLRVVGGQVRASGPLQYPTITSMYLEIGFALVLGAFLAACDRRARLPAVVLFVALGIIGEGIIVTLTRAGLITMAASLLCVGAWRFSRQGMDRGLVGLAALAVLLVLLGASSASAEALRLRFTTEGQRGWYQAAFLAPPVLAFTGGSMNPVDVTVINRGRMTWDPQANPPFHLSYHWFDEAMSRVVAYDGLRTPLPRALAPGDSLSLRIPVRAPKQPGRYTIGWDVVQEGRLWFSTEPGARLALSSVTVGAPASADSAWRDRPWAPVPPQAVRIGRLALWRAALQLVAAHPVLGIGPDNFRLSYGRHVASPRPDARITSNNTYLEILTGTGLIGFAIFAWFIWRAQHAMRAIQRDLTGARASLYDGVVAAAIAIALHGLVDSFLTLTPTYLTMSLVLGLAMAPAGWGSRCE